MLKKISVHDLRVGMHLHALEGAWLDHPFWRTKFVIADSAMIRQLAESPVRECWIDTALGLDVAVPDGQSPQHVATQAELDSTACLRVAVWIMIRIPLQTDVGALHRRLPFFMAGHATGAE